MDGTRAQKRFSCAALAQPAEQRSSMTKTHDAIIIGTGQAGPFMAQRLAGAGMKVAIVERKLFGGTCVNTGCTPTKTTDRIFINVSGPAVVPRMPGIELIPYFTNSSIMDVDFLPPHL